MSDTDRGHVSVDKEGINEIASVAILSGEIYLCHDMKSRVRSNPVPTHVGARISGIHHRSAKPYFVIHPPNHFGRSMCSANHTNWNFVRSWYDRRHIWEHRRRVPPLSLNYHYVIVGVPDLVDVILRFSVLREQYWRGYTVNIFHAGGRLHIFREKTG